MDTFHEKKQGCKISRYCTCNRLALQTANFVRTSEICSAIETVQGNSVEIIFTVKGKVEVSKHGILCNVKETIYQDYINSRKS